MSIVNALWLYSESNLRINIILEEKYDYWKQTGHIGESELGTVLTKVTDEGITFYALVCHSLNNGWCNQTETIQKCFDSIESDEPVASISIGTGLIDILSGANFEEIKKGMEMSKTKIILY